MARQNASFPHGFAAFCIFCCYPLPLVGIGAGAGCDGQVLVYQDMLGMFMDYQPKFVRKFAEVGKTMQDAFVTYRNEIQAGNFPAEEHSFAISDEVMAQLEQEAQA